MEQKEIDQAFAILKQKGYPDGCSINNIESWCWNCGTFTKTIQSPVDWEEMQEDCIVCYADKSAGVDF